MRLALLAVVLGGLLVAGLTFDGRGGVGLEPAFAHCAVVAPANVTVSNNPNQAGAVVNYPAPTTSGSGCTATTTCSPAPGSFFAIGTTTVNCNNTAAGQQGDQFTVRVLDTQPPTVSTGGNRSYTTDPGQPTATVTFPPPTAADNAPGVTTSCTPASGSKLAPGQHVVTCRATDASGNTAQASFTATVSDNEPPKLSLPGDVTSNAPAGQAFAVVSFTPPTVSDNAPGSTVTCANLPGTFYPVGTTEVGCTATDGSGNTVGGKFNVIVRDVETPVIELVLRAKRKLRFVLSEPATLTLNFQRCSKIVKKKCTKYKSRGTAPASGRRGLNDFAFTNRLNGKRLPAGLYRVIFSGTDAAGNAANPATLSFRLR